MHQVEAKDSKEGNLHAWLSQKKTTTVELCRPLHAGQREALHLEVITQQEGVYHRGHLSYTATIPRQFHKVVVTFYEG